MEEILRWGTQDLFQARRDSEDGLTAVQSGEGQGATPMEGTEGEGALRNEGGNPAKVPCHLWTHLKLLQRLAQGIVVSSVVRKGSGSQYVATDQLNIQYTRLSPLNGTLLKGVYTALMFLTEHHQSRLDMHTLLGSILQSGCSVQIPLFSDNTFQGGFGEQVWQH